MDGAPGSSPTSGLEPTGLTHPARKAALSPEWTHDPPPGAAMLFPRRASSAGVFSKQSKETPGQFFPQTRVCCQRIRNS